MDIKMKRGSRSVIKGSSQSRRSGSRNKETCCLSSSVSTAEAAGTSKNALRERTRVESLRRAYLELQAAIPSVPPNTKLSKLDVLVLATTYISHLTQLLQEDDARNSHDDNNNDTACSKDGRGIRDARPVVMQEMGCRRVSQKGLLHPVKKWPMRARLYADVGATDAVDVLAEQSRMANHLQSRLDQRMQPPGPSPFHSATHSNPRTAAQVHHSTNQMQCKQHIPLINFSPCGGAVHGAAIDEFGRALEFFGKGASAGPRPHLLHSSRLNQFEQVPQHKVGGQQPITTSAFPGYTNAWNSESGWDSHMTYNELSACQSQCHMTQPMTNFSGCWSAWNA